MDDKYLCEIRIPVKKMSHIRAPNRRADVGLSRLFRSLRAKCSKLPHVLCSPAAPRKIARGGGGFSRLPQIHFPEPKDGHPLSRVPVFIA